MKPILNAVDWALDKLPGPALVYIAAASTALTAGAEVIAEAGPAGGETAVDWLLRAVAWLAGAAVAIRRVTEVTTDVRGLRLPPGVQLTVTTDHPDGGLNQLVSKRGAL